MPFSNPPTLVDGKRQADLRLVPTRAFEQIARVDRSHWRAISFESMTSKGYEMRGIRGLAWAVLLTAGLGATAAADDMVLEDFGDGASKRWQYAADTVMGGVSDGGAVVAVIDGQPGIRLTGTVSTEFNGGFIQVRRLLRDGLPAETAGIELDVRGNDQRYYIFIRTSEMSRPWYYYGESFEAGTVWQKVQLSLDSFERSHAHLSEKIAPEDIISIAIVAFGRDHEADVSVRRIALF